MDVGAGDIDLQPADLGLLIQRRAGVGVILHRKAADVGHHGLMEALGQAGQFLGNNLIHAGILQADGIDHARAALGDTGSGISETGILGSSLEGKATQTVDIIQLGELIAVAEGAAGGDDGVVHLDAAEGHASVTDYLSHRISSLTSTGPSLQMRLLPVTVLQEQPMQAPKPHPMRSSKLN